ncbi:hypothetical protein HYDPIDRAFT_34872 [Hydnomerulius pinastri MD-312]|uniref:F-box domain-containing protein n=1 Tax=Hydnomerulius pinastri MD-312 TaxID=994086 RepID=A0A0C9VJT1_9AGAM|nr:hypothetical protein HYDPIDRAFT_34872 [Hydnomerulius pinastri MD-312]
MGNSISRALLIRRILEAIGTLSTAPCFRFRMTRSAIANETTRKRKAIVTTADEPTSKRRHIPEPDLLPNIAENIKRKTDTAANLSDGDTPDAKLQRPDEIPHASDDIPAPSMKRKRDTATDISDSDAPDAKRQCLEEEVPHASDVIPAPSMKRKRDTAIDLADSDTPDVKRQRLEEEVPYASDVIPVPSMKRKRDTAIDLADSDTLDAKRRRLEEALDAHLGNAAKSLFILPNELLYSVISFLGVKELRTCTKVSTLQRHSKSIIPRRRSLHPGADAVLAFRRSETLRSPVGLESHGLIHAP